MALNQNFADFFSNNKAGSEEGAKPNLTDEPTGVRSDLHNFFPKPKAVQPLAPIDKTEQTSTTGEQPDSDSPFKSLLGGSFRQSSGYGSRSDPFTGKDSHHSGLDLAAPAGTSIHAAASGRVVHVGDKNDGYGKSVEIEHADGTRTRYAHASQTSAQVGQEVNAGDPIARVGSTGRSTGNHLHFEVTRNGKAVDPAEFFKAQAQARAQTQTQTPAAQLPDLGQAKPWGEIVKNPDFQALDAATKAQAKAAYFDYWIAPHAGTQAGKMREQFLGMKDPSISTSNPSISTKEQGPSLMDQATAAANRWAGVQGKAGEVVGQISNAIQGLMPSAAPSVAPSADPTASELEAASSPAFNYRKPGSPKYDSVMDTGAPTQALSTTSKAPVRPEVRAAFNAQWDAATPEQRDQMTQLEGVYGQLARDRAGVFANSDARLPSNSVANKLDPRIEKRRQELIAKGEDPLYADRAALEAAIRGVTPGKEIDFMNGQYGTLSKSELDFETKALFNDQTGANNPLVRGTAKALLGTGKAALGLYQAYFDFLGANETSAALKKGGDYLRLKEEAIGNRGPFLERNLEGAISSIGQQLPWMLAGAAKGSQAIPLIGMALQTFGQEYSDGTAAGQTGMQAATRAAIFSAFEVIGEKFGLGEQMAALRGAARGMSNDQIIRLLSSALKKEVPGELLTTTGQFAADKWMPKGYALNPNATTEDFVRQVADTIAQTVMQAGIMGAGTTGVSTARRFMNEQGYSAPIAQADAERARTAALQKWDGFIQKPRIEPSFSDGSESVPNAPDQTETSDGRLEPSFTTSTDKNVTVTYPNDPVEPPQQESAPPDTTTPQGPEQVSDQEILDFASTRYQQLRQKRDGSLQTEVGDTGMVDREVPGVGLSQAEAAELEALKKANMDPAVLRQLYGLDQASSNQQQPSTTQEQANAQTNQQAQLDGATPSTSTVSNDGQSSGTTEANQPADNAAITEANGSNDQRSADEQAQSPVTQNRSNLPPVDPAVLEEKGEPIETAVDAERRFAAGERIFAFHEMDELPKEIMNTGELEGYSPDQLLALPVGYESKAPRTEKEARAQRAQQKEAANGTQATETKQTEAQGSETASAGEYSARNAASVVTANLDNEAKIRFADFAKEHAGKPIAQVQLLLSQSEFGSKLAANELGQAAEAISENGAIVADQAIANSKERVVSEEDKLKGRVRFAKLRLGLAEKNVREARDVDQFGLPLDDGQIGPKKAVAIKKLEAAQKELVDAELALSELQGQNKPPQKTEKSVAEEKLQAALTEANKQLPPFFELRDDGKGIALFQEGKQLPNVIMPTPQGIAAAVKLAQELDAPKETPKAQPKTEKESKAAKFYTAIAKPISFDFGNGKINITTSIGYPPEAYEKTYGEAGGILNFELRGDGVNSETGYKSVAGVIYKGDLDEARFAKLTERVARENAKPEDKPKTTKPKTEKESKKNRTSKEKKAQAEQRMLDLLGARVGDTITFNKDIGYVSANKPMLIESISPNGELSLRNPDGKSGTFENLSQIQAQAGRGLTWSVTPADKPKTEKEAKAAQKELIGKKVSFEVEGKTFSGEVFKVTDGTASIRVGEKKKDAPSDLRPIARVKVSELKLGEQAPSAPVETPTPSTNTNLDSMFDDVLAEELGKDQAKAAPPKTEKAAKQQRTAKAAAASAAKNTADGLTNAIDGLGALFGGKNKGTLGSGPVFNEETYAQAKPLFQAAIANLKDAGTDIKEAMRTIIRMVLDKFGAQAAQGMKPYVVRFVEENSTNQDSVDGNLNQEQNNSQEKANDSTNTSNPAEVDNSLDQRQLTGTSQTPAKGDGANSAGQGSGDDGPLRGAKGRIENSADEAESVGNGGGTTNVQPANNGAVARDRKRRASRDFIPAVGGLTREGSWFDTAQRNIDLIELAIKIQDEKRAATPEEQAQLSKYVGFGASAIRNALFPVPPSYAKSREPDRLIWPEFVREARYKPLAERIAALPREWQQSILQSSQYAHYTSEGIIRSVWTAIERIGFTGGSVFEPGMGIGSFAMLMPQTLRGTSSYTGIEFDAPTAMIAGLLSPDQHMLHGDFIKRKFPKNFFDVNVGNPPFSQTKIFGDPDYEKQGFMLHDFFFAKGIDLVRPGGIQVFVTSKGTMDKQNDKARKYLSERADLLGAIRLPSTAFEDNAGTSVVTDVIFLRKRLPGEAVGGQPWGGVATVDTPDGPVVVNEYFAAHPEMVLGQQRISGNTDDLGRRINSNGMGGEKYTVVSYDKTAADLDAKFAKAIENLPANAYSVLSQSPESIKQETAKFDFDPTIKREGVVYLAKDGSIMRIDQGVGKPLDSMVKLNDKDRAWFKDYVQLRDLVQNARFSQLQDTDWKTALKNLNTAYDKFVKTHGYLNDYSVRVRKSTDEDGNPVQIESRFYKNARLFREDYDRSLVESLDIVTEDGRIVKAPFLIDRTIGNPVTRDVKSIGDALAVSLDEVGKLDLDLIANRMNLSREETIDALGNQIYQTPTGQWQLADEYLSGDVVTKLSEAEEGVRTNPALARNIEALKEVQPEKLGPAQISARLGASWIPDRHVNDFAYEIGAGEVKFDPKTETWAVAGGKLRSQRSAGAEWGTAARSPSELLEAILNSRPIKITYRDQDKKTHTDQEATTAANEMAKKISDKFKSWVWTDKDRVGELVEEYNKRFNNIAPRRFDGSHMSLPGLSLRFKLHPHQKRAIWRIVQTGNTYLAHAVGAGKTIEMIVGGMEQKRLGLIKKPMYVVPNHMLEQFSNEFMELYPLANIMVADDENFSKERRRAFVASATLNAPDAIIITHDAYQRIGVKEESVAPIRDEIIADLEIALADTAETQENRVRRGQLQQQIEAVTQKFDRIISAGGKDSTIKFEDMGVDFIFADEAHVFRKLDFHTSQTVKGVDPNGSKRAIDMYVKTRVLDKARPGRSFVFASGTPVTNTMGELYTIMRFFAPEAMARDGIESFDGWSRMFAERVTALEPNAAGKYESVERFSKFDNVPELMSRVRMFMDVLTSDNLGALVKRPDVKGGKPNLNLIPMNAALKSYMEGELATRIKQSKDWKPSRDQPNNPDPIVAIITDGRFAALDPRFFGGMMAKGETSIINEMGDKVAAYYHATKDNVYKDKETGKDEPIKGSTQIVFFNLGFGAQSQASRGFNSRAAFTKRLTDGGIPRDEIAWFEDADSDAKKEAIFKDMRSGKLKVLIGSAKKMGTGVNVQKRLAVLHYQDPPWYPADVEQPHGRIIRQGNQNPEVNIEWYSTKGTYQSTMWQMVARKQRFIDQAFSGDKSLRSMDDLGEASQFEQAAAVASGDPRAIQLAGLRQDVDRFTRLQAAHESEQMTIRSALKNNEWRAQTITNRIKEFQQAYKAIGEKFFTFTSATVEGKSYDTLKEFGQAVKDTFNKIATESIGKRVRGKVIVELAPNVNLVIGNDVDGHGKPKDEYELSVDIDGFDLLVTNGKALGDDVDPMGLARRIFNRINGVEAELTLERTKLSDVTEETAKLTKKYGAPFEYAQEMAEKYSELKSLEDQLQAEGQEQPAASNPVIREDGTDGNEPPTTLNNIQRQRIKKMVANPYFETGVFEKPERVGAMARLKALEAKREAGKITDAEYRLGVQQLITSIQAYREGKETERMIKGKRRGAEWVIAKLRRGVADGKISKEEADFTEWLLNQNPDMAKHLAISILEPKEGDNSAGSYLKYGKTMRIIANVFSGDTTVHEILHHTERMMPPAVQEGILKEWQRAWDAAYKKGDEALKAALRDMLDAMLGNKAAQARVNQAFESGLLNYDDHYQLYSPSEYWAVNGTRILADRRMASRSWVRQAAQWLKEFIERLKNLLGLPSDAPILKALRAIVNTDGTMPVDSMQIQERDISQWLNEKDQDDRGQSGVNGQEPVVVFNNIQRKVQNNILQFFGNQNPKTFNWYDKTISTQYNKALKDKHYGKVYSLLLGMQNHVSMASIRAANIAPGIMPRVDDFKSAAARVFSQSNREHVDNAAKALFAGTLAGDTVLDGKVWTDDELRNNFRLNDTEIALYYQARAAINASLDEVSAAEAYSVARGYLNDKVVRAAVIEAPWFAEGTITNAMNAQIKVLEKLIEIEKKAGNDGQVLELTKNKDEYQKALVQVEKIFLTSANLKRAGYVPLMRFGEYTVSAQYIDPQTGDRLTDADGNPQTAFFGRFETKAEANNALRELQKDYSGRDDVSIKLGTYNDTKHELYAGVDPETLQLFAEAIGADQLMKAQIRLAKSDRSALKRRLERKGTPGYNTDLPRVMASFITSNARHAAQQLYMGAVSRAIKYIPNEKGDVQKEAQRLRNFVVNPSDAGAFGSGLLFAWFLGGSPAAAAVNATQPFMVTMPYLSQFVTPDKAGVAMAKAAPYAMGKKEITDPELRKALKKASLEGVVDAQEIFHLYSLGSRQMAMGTKSQAALTLWGSMFSAVEGLNRRMSFIAAWDIAIQTGEKNPYAFAIRAVNSTQGIYNKVNRPNLAQNTIGRLVFTYKGYALMVAELMVRMWNSGPHGKRAVMVMLAMLMLASGEEGLPGSKMLDDLIDTIGQMLGFDTNARRWKRRTAYELLGKTAGDLFLYGVSSKLPLDFSGRLGLGSMVPGTEMFKPSSEVFNSRSANEIIGPSAGLVDQLGDAIKAANSGNYAKAAENLAPKAVRDVAAAASMLSKGYATDARGNKTVNTTGLDAAIKAFGFNPTVVAENTREKMPIRQDERLRSAKATEFSERLQRALMEKDEKTATRESNEVMADVEKWNKRNPDTMIDPVNIRNSGIRRARDASLDSDERTLKRAPKTMRERMGLDMLK
jgi:N12 class adenine-specific DNA methylase/murein DD-endopeptidase MepM/ murein hydrolase activator NlpD